jgi:transposase
MDMQNETLIILCMELYQEGLPKSRIAARLRKNRETIHIWIKGVEQLGLTGFLDKYRQAKKGERAKRSVDPLIKRWIWEIRDREYDCCGQKIQYFLGQEHGVHLSVPKIYEILAESSARFSILERSLEINPQAEITLSGDTSIHTGKII